MFLHYFHFCHQYRHIVLYLYERNSRKIGLVLYRTLGFIVSLLIMGFCFPHQSSVHRLVSKSRLSSRFAILPHFCLLFCVILYGSGEKPLVTFLPGRVVDRKSRGFQASKSSARPINKFSSILLRFYQLVVLLFNQIFNMLHVRSRTQSLALSLE